MKKITYLAAVVTLLLAGVSFAFLLDGIEAKDLQKVFGYCCATLCVGATSCTLWFCHSLYK